MGHVPRWLRQQRAARQEEVRHPRHLIHAANIKTLDDEAQWWSNWLNEQILRTSW